MSNFNVQFITFCRTLPFNWSVLELDPSKKRQLNSVSTLKEYSRISGNPDPFREFFVENLQEHKL